MSLMGTALVLGVVIAQSCLNLCDPKDYSLPGSSVHGNSQARIVEWVAIPFSRGSSQIRDGTHVSRYGRQILYHYKPPGRPVLEVASAQIFQQKRNVKKVHINSICS